MLSLQDIREKFQEGFDCSQVVLMAYAESLGYTPKEAARMAAAFGGGMFRGDTCGAVAGAMIAIGLGCGHDTANDEETKQALMRAVADFQQTFTEIHGSTICRDLIDFDFAEEGRLEEAVQSGQLLIRCPKYVETAVNILEDIL